MSEPLEEAGESFFGKIQGKIQDTVGAIRHHSSSSSSSSSDNENEKKTMPDQPPEQNLVTDHLPEKIAAPDLVVETNSIPNHFGEAMSIADHVAGANLIADHTAATNPTVEHAAEKKPILNHGPVPKSPKPVLNHGAMQKPVLSEKFRLFGRQTPVHSALGGGKSADIMLWRNKQVSASLLAGATVIWLLFEWIGYHLLTFVCHSLILTFTVLFLWSNFSVFFQKNPHVGISVFLVLLVGMFPKASSSSPSTLDFPEVVLQEDMFTNIALVLRDRFNHGFALFREVAFGKDLKKFFYAIVGLWFVSIVGSWFDLLTLLYIMFLMVLTMPLFYEMREDQVDAYAEKATMEIKKQYVVLDEKVLQKLPKVPFFKDKLH